jgi:hypothetical protein
LGVIILYLSANIAAAEAAYDELMALVEERARELEALSGYPTRLEVNENLQVPATTRIAWKYGLNHHLLRYRVKDKAVTPHVLLHELEHIAMEAEARQVGRNLTFTADAAAEQLTTEAIADHTRKLLREGMSKAYVDRWTRQTVHIVRSQLYNMPLDMIIEQRLMDRYEALRPSQFASLYKLQQDALPVLTDEHIRKTTAPIIYRATVSLNYALALCIDSLYGHRTDYAAPYKREGSASAGSRIFTLWQRATRNFEPGDEHRLVDTVADLLKLHGWYAWQDDPGDPAVDEPDLDRPQGVTNEELLDAKNQAAVMYCLDALERFEGMTRDQVLKIASEIALMGSGGLDYTSSEKKYHMTAYEDESFSGLHVMCLMYAGFQKVDPSVDLQLPLGGAYREALELFGEK